jgi:hypothetical protein
MSVIQTGVTDHVRSVEEIAVGADRVNEAEAQELLSKELAVYRDWPYERLCELVGEPKLVFDVLGPSGVPYKVDIYAFWDGRAHRDVRVCGSIDDGGVSAFMPLTEDFIKAPDGSFVGET